jgi:antitoxin (DNA-binding transcriptional repressor) of toxin-antitoxin stability system
VAQYWQRVTSLHSVNNEKQGRTMRTLGIREVRQRYEILKETLDAEGEVLLTHHGKPFARVLPLEPTKVRPKWKPHDQLRAMLPFQMVPSEVLIAEDREDR